MGVSALVREFEKFKGNAIYKVLKNSPALLDFLNKNSHLLQQLDRSKLNLIGELLANRRLIDTLRYNPQLLKILKNQQTLDALLKLANDPEMINFITYYTDDISSNLPLIKKFIKNQNLMNLVRENSNLITKLAQNKDDLKFVAELLDNEELVRTISNQPELTRFMTPSNLKWIAQNNALLMELVNKPELMQHEEFIKDLLNKPNLLKTLSDIGNNKKAMDLIQNSNLLYNQALIDFLSENVDKISGNLKLFRDLISDQNFLMVIKNQPHLLDFLSQNMDQVLWLAKDQENLELLSKLLEHKALVVKLKPLLKIMEENPKLINLIIENIDVLAENTDAISKLLTNEVVMTLLKEKPTLVEFLGKNYEAIDIITSNHEFTRLIEDKTMIEKLANQPTLLSTMIDKFDDIAMIAQNSDHFPTIESLLSNHRLMDVFENQPDVVNSFLQNFNTVSSLLKNEELTKFINDNPKNVQNLLSIAMARKEEIQTLLHCDKKAGGLAKYLIGLSQFVCKEGRVDCFEDFLKHTLAKKGLNIPYMQE